MKIIYTWALFFLIGVSMFFLFGCASWRAVVDARAEQVKRCECFKQACR